MVGGFHTVQDADLPHGEDRFVLAATQHLAITRESPVIYFDRVGSILEMFGLSEGGKTIELLRQPFDRLASFSIRLVLLALILAGTQVELAHHPAGERILVSGRHRLPTRTELEAERELLRSSIRKS